MSSRRIYSVCAISYAATGQISEFIVGFTVADSREAVDRIIRNHVGPGRRFSVFMASAGSGNSKTARHEAEILESFDHEWLDPRPQDRSVLPTGRRVAQLMASDAEL